MFHVCLSKVSWITLDPCLLLLGSRHWFDIGAVRGVRLWWGGLCTARGVLLSWGLCGSACVHSPADRSSCRRNRRKGKLQEQRGLVPLQPYSWEKWPFSWESSHIELALLDSRSVGRIFLTHGGVHQISWQRLSNFSIFLVFCIMLKHLSNFISNSELKGLRG